ncbi:galactose mutarotase [Clostridium sediminicola]|uniref:aldose epimerase family protein n=1 Tax=Clostridium sediminicola TaxID=3114879 RepID=UPI0031F24DA7
MKIINEVIGKTKDGNEIRKYSIVNSNNSYVSILNLGGIISEIYVPDKDGAIENVVVSFENPEDYIANQPYFGALIGRVGGRISNAEFSIEDKKYVLAKNNNNSNLHGGPKGFEKILWSVKELNAEDYSALELTHLSPDGDQGFPGNLSVKVTYKFNNSNDLEIFYEATTDKDTIVNLTNHSYFNLSGNLKSTILNHKLKIDADKFGVITKDVLPTGEMRDVTDTPFDFKFEKKVGSDIKSNYEQIENGGGYDHPFILNKSNNPVVVLLNEENGRKMEVTTDQASVVLYTSNSMGNNLILQNNIKSCDYIGLCLETQYYPDAINQQSFPTKILSPGEKYTAWTKYSFSLI